MDEILNKEFYINIAFTLLLTLAAVVSNFNLDLTVIMGVAWFFLIVIYSVKLSGVLTKSNIKLKDIENIHSVGK